MAKIVIILVHRCVKIKGVNIWKALGNVYTIKKKSN